MIVRFTVFGYEVWALEFGETVEEEAEEEQQIGAGSTHNFDRDTEPYSPDDRWIWPWDDKHRGFGFRK